MKVNLFSRVPERVEITRGPRLRDGIGLVSGFVPACIFTDALYAIPHRQFKDQHGYQREPQIVRIKKLVSDLREGKVDLPTAILVNIRGVEWEDCINSSDNRLFLNIEFLVENDKKLYVVDGQHRVRAIEILVNEDPENWSDFQVPFVAMVGANEKQEMEQFFIVNSTAKSVRTDLALDLLRQRALNDPRVMDSLIKRGERWKIEAQGIAQQLELMSPVWKGKIKFPNEDKYNTIIGSAAFVSSLKPVVDFRLFKLLSESDKIKILDCYWKAIRNVMRPAFDDDPTDYAIQKGIGVYAMHMIFPSVVELVQNRKGDLLDVQNYEDVMEEILNSLEGENADGNVVSGAEFWESGVTGAAGSYSSSAGKKVLIAKLEANLPRITV